MTSHGDVYYDPYDFDIDTDPHLRSGGGFWDEAPLYHNEKHDFFALSRFDDVEKGLLDWETYRSGKGSILELIRADIEIPSGAILFEDPPEHHVHRTLMSRVFTPKRMNDLEPKVREYCRKALDPLVGRDGFDFIEDLGGEMPMRVIGFLLGIPEQDQRAIKERLDAGLRIEEGQEATFTADATAGHDMFAEYVEWRATHPSDDLMTQLLNAEFEDETGHCPTPGRARRCSEPTWD